MSNHQIEAPREQDPTFQARLSLGSGTVKPYTSYQLFLLLRLQQMVERRRQYKVVPEPEGWLVHAMDKAIYSTFLDCSGEGLAEEARAILGNDQGTFPSPLLGN